MGIYAFKYIGRLAMPRKRRRSKLSTFSFCAYFYYINNLILRIMKKNFYYLFGVTLVTMLSASFVSCGDDDDSDSTLVVTPGSVSMHYEDTKQLKADGATTWTTSNDFVAKVDSKGLVTGNHVGKAQIIASNGSSSGKCDVEITPEYSLYDDPYLDWGASMSTVKSSVKKELQGSDEKSLTYKYYIGSNVCLVGYYFDNNKLKSILTMFSYTYYARAAYYLLERFQPLYKDDDNYFFMDAMTTEKAKTIVLFGTYKSGSTTVTSIYYSENSESSSRSANRAIENSSKIEEYQANMAKYLE